MARMAYTLSGALGVSYDKDCWKSCYYSRPEGEGSYAANQRCIAQCGGGGVVAPSSSSLKWWLIGAGALGVAGVAYLALRK